MTFVLRVFVLVAATPILWGSNMKRIIFCFDGTWNRIDADHPTNVLLMASSITPITDDGVTQIVHYDNGVGTSYRDKILGGVTGYGLFENIEQAYQFLIFNYHPGDEIYCFGFSRGAFTARSFIGFIRAVGIIERRYAKEIKQATRLYKRSRARTLDSSKMLEFRAKYSSTITVCREDEEHRCKVMENYVPGQSIPFRIRYVGLWDTVETLGTMKVIWPWLPFTRKRSYVGPGHKYHNHKLSGMISAGRHAVALDERRRNFDIEPWGNVEKYNEQVGYGCDHKDSPFKEVFFPGVHGSVGGGGAYRGLSDETLNWIQSGAAEQELVLDRSKTSIIYASAPDYTTRLDNNYGEKKGIFGFITGLLPMRWRSHVPKSLDAVSKSAQNRWAYSNKLEDGQYRPKTLESLSGDLNALDAVQQIERKQTSGIIDSTIITTSVDPPLSPLKYHLVKRDDTLSKLAETYLGDMKRYMDIFHLNKDILTDPNRIYVGQILRIPLVGNIENAYKTADDASSQKS